jgi:hypothetical protein
MVGTKPAIYNIWSLTSLWYNAAVLEQHCHIEKGEMQAMAREGPNIVIERVDDIWQNTATSDVVDQVVHIANRGAAILLRNWRLSNDQGKEFIFPLIVLTRDQSLRIHTGKGNDSSTDLYWGLNEPVWRSEGDSVVLYNDASVEVDRYRYAGANQVSQPTPQPARTEPATAQRTESHRVQEPSAREIAPSAEPAPTAEVQTTSPKKRKLYKLPWLRSKKGR